MEFWNEPRREMNEGARLPQRPPDRVWGGPSTGATCALCGAKTTGDETEMEIEYDLNSSETKTFHLHARCFFVLERGRWTLS